MESKSSIGPGLDEKDEKMDQKSSNITSVGSRVEKEKEDVDDVSFLQPLNSTHAVSQSSFSENASRKKRKRGVDDDVSATAMESLPQSSTLLASKKRKRSDDDVSATAMESLRQSSTLMAHTSMSPEAKSQSFSLLPGYYFIDVA